MLSQSTEAGTEQPARLDSKLRRQLGVSILNALADKTTEDIYLNPDGQLWIKRMSEQSMFLGTMLSVHALSAMRTSIVYITPLLSPFYFGECLDAWTAIPMGGSDERPLI
jgi:hypothetical protein